MRQKILKLIYGRFMNDQDQWKQLYFTRSRTEIIAIVRGGGVRIVQIRNASLMH